MSWRFAADDALVEVAYVREAREYLIADRSGGIYRLDQRGQIMQVTRALNSLSELASCDTGDHAIVLRGDTELCLLNRDLEIVWNLELPEACLALAMSPYGNHFVVTLANAENLIFDINRNLVGHFETIRPLSFLAFSYRQPVIVAAAEYSILCCYNMSGQQVWNQKMWSNVGDLSLAGQNSAILLAGFNHGLQLFSGKTGDNRSSYVMDGTVNHASIGYVPARIAASTLEGHLYWLDADGELLWATELEEELHLVRCGTFSEGFVCGFRSGRVVRLDWGEPD